MTLCRSLAMEATDLELVKLDIEPGDKVLKDIATFIEELCCEFVCEDLLDVLVWPFKVWEQ